MGFVARELDRIQSRIGDPTDANYAALRAAQQALAWALEPGAMRSPLYSITGNPEDAADCLEEIRPPLSSRSDDASEDGSSGSLQHDVPAP